MLTGMAPNPLHQKLARHYYRLVRIRQILLHESNDRRHSNDWRERIHKIVDAALEDRPEGPANQQRLADEIESLEAAFELITRDLDGMVRTPDARVSVQIGQLVSGVLGRTNAGSWSPSSKKRSQ